MRNGCAESSPLLSEGGTSLLSRAISIVAREAARLSTAPRPNLASLGAPTASPVSLPGAGVPPVSGLDDMRRLATELAEAPTETAGPVGGPRAVGDADRVPLLRCVAPVQAGGVARAGVRVANEESEPAEVALYCSNFVGDSGYEIPSLRVTASPRVATIPAGEEATFEIRIAVSQQAPAGTYSGLIQAMGSRYVKAVLSVDVL